MLESVVRVPNQLKTERMQSMPDTAFGTAMMDGINDIWEHKHITPAKICSMANLRSHDLKRGIRYSLRVAHQNLAMPISDSFISRELKLTQPQAYRFPTMTEQLMK